METHLMKRLGLLLALALDACVQAPTTSDAGASSRAVEASLVREIAAVEVRGQALGPFDDARSDRCDPSASPHILGTAMPAITGLSGAVTATGPGVVAATISSSPGSVPVAGLGIGSADQLLDTNHGATTAEWFTLGGDGTFASHNLTVVQITGSSGVCTVPTAQLDFGATYSAEGQINFPSTAQTLIAARNTTSASHDVALLSVASNGVTVGDVSYGGTTSVQSSSEILISLGGTYWYLNSGGMNTSSNAPLLASADVRTTTNVVVASVTEDLGGGAGLLDIAPVTTVPTALPTTHIGLFENTGTVGINATGVLIPNTITTVFPFTAQALASTSAGSGATGQRISYGAQPGQAATGGGNSGGTGGEGRLFGATGGSSAAANGGGGGNGQLTGGTGGAATGGTGNGGQGGDAWCNGGPGGTTVGGTAGGIGTCRLRAASVDIATAGPNADGTNVFDVVGATGIHSVTKTTNYTIDSGATPDTIVYANFSAAHTITLPTPRADRWIVVKDISGTAGTNAITIARHASETIDGFAGNYPLGTNYGHVTLHSDGTNWWIVQ